MFRTTLGFQKFKNRLRLLSRLAVCTDKNLSCCSNSWLRQGSPYFIPALLHIRDIVTEAQSFAPYIDASDTKTYDIMIKDVRIIEDFVSEEEEKSLVDEVEPYLKRLHYEKNHWDDAIQGYRETERKNWREKNKSIIQRLRETALPKEESQITLVHVLDLAEDGVIKPHIDSIRFCGSTIAGLSLLSPSIMRFVHETDKTSSADVLLKRRSLYIITDRARYDYTHEILPKEESVYKGEVVPKGRRISVICRTEPPT